MSLLLTCLFIAAILPYLAKIPLTVAMVKAGGYNNHYPREQQANLQGFGARALAAHQNSFESLLIFSTAILAAVATNNHSSLIEWMAILHILARFVYHLLYLLDLATLRSLIWGVSLASSLIILGSCI